MGLLILIFFLIIMIFGRRKAFVIIGCLIWLIIGIGWFCSDPESNNIDDNISYNYSNNISSTIPVQNNGPGWTSTTTVLHSNGGTGEIVWPMNPTPVNQKDIALQKSGKENTPYWNSDENYYWCKGYITAIREAGLTTNYVFDPHKDGPCIFIIFEENEEKG